MTYTTDGGLPLDINGRPAQGVYVPNVGTVAQQGVLNNTDNGGQAYAAEVVQLAAGTSTVGSVVLNNGTKATYTYAISATAPYATATDWIVVRGSASKTIKIVRVELSGAATAATTILATLKKHTIANTAGTSTNPTPMQHDSNDAAAFATVLLYSAAPTIDASATIWKNVRIDLTVVPGASANAVDRYVYEYGAQISEPLILRGVAQEFAINLGGAAVPSGGVYDASITWTEE